MEIEVSYEYYDSYTRNILKSIGNIRDKNSFRIDWENPNNRIYLAENEYLIWQLQNCDNFVDDKLKNIIFEDELGKITISIKKEKEKELLISKIIFSHKGKKYKKFSFVNENYIFLNNTIYPIKPLSENFNNLYLFESSLLPNDLEKFLSLLYSYFDNISLNYENYKQIKGTPKELQPTLIFEKIDADNSLYLRVSNSFSRFDIDFFDNYDISRIALINDLEKTIVISDIIHKEIYQYFKEIEKLLKTYQRKHL